MQLAGRGTASYALRMRRKVPDTWWGAIIVGALAGGAGGITFALLNAIWSDDSVAHLMFVNVPAWIAGGIVLYVLVHARKTRRASPNP